MTPEARVKNKIKKVLDVYEDRVYTFMPVPMGYGAVTVDFLVCAAGLFIGIEAKAPGKHPTVAQEETLRRIIQAGGRVFVIDSEESVLLFDGWLAVHMTGK